MVRRKYIEDAINEAFFARHNIFYKYKCFIFQPMFWSIFNHCQKGQSNQEQCSLCCSSSCFCVLLCTYYGPLQCISTNFRKSKETEVLRSIFLDNVINVLWSLRLYFFSSCKFRGIFVDFRFMTFIHVLR